MAATGGTPALAMSLPGAAGLVPDWDGESDSIPVRVRVRRAGLLTLDVRDRSGRTVAVLARDTLVRPGALTTWWSGRDAAGEPLDEGSYAIVATLRAAQAATSRDAGAAAAATEMQRVIVNVRAPNLSVSRLRTSRAFIAARRSTRSVGVSFRLSRAGVVSAVIATPDGSVIRNLVRSRRRSSGTTSLTWDGRADDGRRAADGSYVMLVSGTTGSLPSNTLRTPLLVDTRAPALTRRRERVRARVRGGRTVVSLPLVLGEGVRIVVARGSHTRELDAVGAGRRSVGVRGDDLGIAPRARPMTYRVRVTALDGAGNATAVTVLVTVPAVHRPAPQPSPSVRPEPVHPPAGGGLSWPVHGSFTSPYGQRWGRLHAGVDVAAPTGTPIVAAAAGIVSFAGTMGGYGNVVMVEHPRGMTTLYAHQSRLAVVVGQAVSRGQLVGYVGSTGHSTGPHLHFETRVGGVALDPMRFLPAGGPPA